MGTSGEREWLESATEASLAFAGERDAALDGESSLMAFEARAVVQTRRRGNHFGADTAGTQGDGDRSTATPWLLDAIDGDPLIAGARTLSHPLNANNSARLEPPARRSRVDCTLMSCHNASPETVSLAVLDACERGVRGAKLDFHDPRNSDAKFMASCVKTYASRVRMLKSQAAAGWKPEFSWMLERCHSIAIDDVDFAEKEGVRTEKLRCMACGRHEHCCKKALNGVGSFEFDRFNSGDASDLQPAWQVFNRQYEQVCRGAQGAPSGKLLACDFGEFTIGSTCLRKAELFYMCNTLMMECCYESLQSCKDLDDFRWSHDPMTWHHATAGNAAALVERVRDLELAIADDRRPVPAWGIDTVLWDSINDARRRAGAGDPDRINELLRERAQASLAQARLDLYADDGRPSRADDGEDDDYDLVGSSDEGEEEPPQRNSGKALARRRCVLDDESSGDDEPSQSAPVPKRACAQRGVKKRPQSAGDAPALRRSKRLGGSKAAGAAGPSDAPAPAVPVVVEQEQAVEPMEHAEEEDEALPAEDPLRRRTRAPAPNAAALAQQQRAPGQRLPARREALFNLGTLQLKLMREGRDSDSAICTTAMFVIQELLARVDHLQHTAGI